MAALREDVVKITFEVENDPLQEIESAMDSIVNEAEKAVSQTETAASEAVREVSDAVTEIMESASTAAETSAEAASTAAEGVESVASAIEGEYVHAMNYFGDTAESAGSRASAIMEELNGVIIGPVKSGIMSLGSAIKEKAVSAVQNLGDKIKSLPKAALDKIVSGIKKIPAALKSITVTALKKLAEGFKTAGKAALDAAKNVAQFAGKAVVGGFAAVTGGLVAAVKAGSEFESAFAQVRTIMDPAEMGFDEMSSGIKKLSDEMGVSTTELSSTVYNAISATGDTANALTLAEQASKLATAGFTDTGSSLSVLTTAMNAYGLSADQASHISDSLIMVQNKGVTTVADLASSMGKAIASASAYGVDLENLEAAYISITKAGINTAEGTTYISSMMKELGDSGSTAAKTLKQQTGKSFDEMMKSGQGLNDALQALSDSVKGDSTALMNLWSSAEAGKASAAIVGQGLDNFKDNLDELRTASGQTEDAFVTMQSTFENKVKRMKTIGTNLLASIYDGMKEDLGGYADFGIKAMETLSESFKQGGITGLAASVGDVLTEAIGMAVDKIPDLMDTGVLIVGSLLDGIKKNADRMGDGALAVIKALASGAARLTPRLLNTGLHLVTSVLSGIAANSTQIVPGAVMLITEIGNTVAAWGPSIMNYGMEIVTNVLGGLIQALPSMISGGMNMIASVLTGIAGYLPTLIPQGVQTVLSVLQGITAGLPNLLSAGINVIQSIAQGIGNALPLVIEQGPKIIHDLISSIVAALPDLATAIFEGIVNIITNLPGLIAGAIKGLGGGIIDGIKSWFTGGEAETEAAGTTTVESVSTGITSATPQLETAMKTSAEAATNSFSDSVRTSGAPKMVTEATDATQKFQEPFNNIDLTTAGEMAGQGFAQGLRNSRAAIMAEAQGIANDVQNTINSSLKVASPSRVAMQTGQFFGKGLALGLEKTQPEVRVAAANMAGVVRGYADPVRGTGGTTIANDRSRTQNNTYAPQFNLTLNGTSATPATERKVRKWVREAINDTFDDLGRQSGYAMG